MPRLRIIKRSRGWRLRGLTLVELQIAILLLAWAPAVLVMGVIFLASSQHNPTFVSNPTVDVVLKKLAHAFGYGLLSVSLAMGITLTVDVRRGGFGLLTADLERRTFFAAWALATAYACTDEFHQSFVPGRSVEAGDVAADVAGVLLAVLFGRALWRLLGMDRTVR